MDTLIWIIISGMAVAFTTELLIRVLQLWVAPRNVRVWGTVPLSLGACYLVGIPYPSIVVATFAVGFFSTTLLLIIDRASIVSIRRKISLERASLGGLVST
jgi:hypothetical protein